MHLPPDYLYPDTHNFKLFVLLIHIPTFGLCHIQLTSLTVAGLLAFCFFLLLLKDDLDMRNMILQVQQIPASFEVNMGTR